MDAVISKELRDAIVQEVLAQDDLLKGNDQISMAEIGVTGLQRDGGYIRQEFLPHLRWPRAAKIYQEMESNDPVVGAIIYVCEQMIRRTEWRVARQGNEKVDLEARDFLEECLHDMETPWNDIISEILTMLTYGFSWHEVVYKYRDGDNRDPRRFSEYSDNRIGWRKIAGRSQATIEEWVFTENDEIKAAIQQSYTDWKKRTIPYSKSLLFRTRYRYGNPEGRSLLRNAYRPWYFKKHIEEIEGIGIERDLAGLPVLQPPAELDLWNPHNKDVVRLRLNAEQLVRNIRRDQNEGVVIPGNWELKLLSTQSRRQFDSNAIINRYDQRIAMTLLADLVLLGADKVGSFALADVKKSLLAVSLESVLSSVADVFNRIAIPNLFKLNVFPGLTKYPKLEPSKVITPELNEFARYIQALSGSKMPLFPNEDLEEYCRGLVGMPSVKEQSAEERQATLDMVNSRPDYNFDDHSHPTGVDSRADDGRIDNTGNIQELGG